VLQMRQRPQTWRAMLRPLILVAVAGVHYLRPVHLAGDDAALIGVLGIVGILLGASSGVATRQWRTADGVVMSQAGLLAALLWVAGMGVRLAFSVYASSAAGSSSVGRFSLRHDITSAQIWTTALVLMAIGEVLARVAYLQLRATWLRSGKTKTFASR
jgi:hypothetical protein